VELGGSGGGHRWFAFDDVRRDSGDNGGDRGSGGGGWASRHFSWHMGGVAANPNRNESISRDRQMQPALSYCARRPASAGPTSLRAATHSLAGGREASSVHTTSSLSTLALTVGASDNDAAGVGDGLCDEGDVSAATCRPQRPTKPLGNLSRWGKPWGGRAGRGGLMRLGRGCGG
jgi:hypothetical protein